MRSMPAVLEVIFRADRRRPDPPTVEVDMRRVIQVGIAAWLVALVVIWQVGTVGTTPLWTCGFGAALGVLALLWERVRGR